jgi:hypothetical protein
MAVTCPQDTSAKELSSGPVKNRVMKDPIGEFDCMYCGTNTAFRSHRKHFFEFLRTRLTGKVPFRCHRCNRRFWAIIDPRDL